MPLLNLTREKKDELLKQRDDKLAEVKILQKMTVKQLWLNDLDATLKELELQERLEKEESMATIALSNKAASKKKTMASKVVRAQQGAHVDTKPSANAKFVDPPSAEELKKDAKKVGIKRGVKADAKKLDDEERAMPLDSDEELAGKSLKERLNDSGHGGKALELLDSSPSSKQHTAKMSTSAAKSAATKGVKRTKTVAAAKPKSKQMKLTDMAGPKKGAKGTKTKKGKSPWETDSEEDEEDVSSGSVRGEENDSDDDGSDLEVVVKKEPVKKEAASKVKSSPAKARGRPAAAAAKASPQKKSIKLEISDEDSEFEIKDEEEDVDSPVVAPKQSARSGRSKKQVNYGGMMDEDEAEDDESDDVE